MKKKQFIMDWLQGEDPGCWIHNKKKRILVAPTGSGKTTLVLDVILKEISRRRKGRLCSTGKLLILCNRTLLRQQFWYALIRKYSNYRDLYADVEVRTYQELSEQIRTLENVDDVFSEYCYIVMDEVHFFMNDADFNSRAYLLLHQIIRASILLPVLMLTATADDFLPNFKNIFNKEVKMYGGILTPDCKEIITYDFSMYADYSYLKPIALESIDDLVLVVGRSAKKSIIFVDDIKRGEELRAQIKQVGGLTDREVVSINSEIIDSGTAKNILDPLTMLNRLDCKVLITTSCLDNGVSIVDSEVENIAIITESKTSFIQMVGRVRTASPDYSVNLLLVKRNAKEFELHREESLCAMQLYKNLVEDHKHPSNRRIAYSVWDNPESKKALLYRQFLIPAPRRANYLSDSDYRNVTNSDTGSSVWQGDNSLVFNDFAAQKIENIFLTNERYYALSMCDPIEVLFDQLKWLGKSQDDLEIRSSTAREELENEFISLSLGVTDYSNTQLQNYKTEVNSKYRKYLFSDIVFKAGSFSTEKLQQILNRFGLILTERLISGTKRYTIERSA